MSNRIILIALSFLILSGCSTVLTYKPISTPSHIETLPAVESVIIIPQGEPVSVFQPITAVKVVRRSYHPIATTQSIQAVRKLSPESRKYVWLGGLITGLEIGLSTSNASLGILSAIIPIGSLELLYKKKVNTKEVEGLIYSEPEFSPLPNYTLNVKIQDFAWPISTDEDGIASVDVRSIAPLAEPGQDLRIVFEDSKSPEIYQWAVVEDLVLEKYRRDISQQPKGFYTRTIYPPQLEMLGFQFLESSGDKRLEGYEEGEIRFLLQNNGRGKAQGLLAYLLNITNTRGIQFDQFYEVGNIDPGQTRGVEIPIKGLKNLDEGRATLMIEIKEHFGYDLDPISVSFETIPFLPPKVEIVDIQIDDDQKGDSFGDNDGRIEPGELIEVEVVLQNVGDNRAEVLNLNLRTLQDQNFDMITENTLFSLQQLERGETWEVQFVFRTNRRFNLTQIPIQLSLSERHGEYGWENRDLGLAVNQPIRLQQQFTISGVETALSPVQVVGSSSIDIETIPTNPKAKIKEALFVIFGIEHYRYEHVPPVTYANRDASVFHDYATRYFSIDPRNIYFKTDQDVTKAEFDKVFGPNGWLERRVTPGETEIFVFYAGHGAPDIKSRSAYLVPYDVDPNYAHTGYGLKDLYQQLASIGAKHVTVFLDACFSGQARGGELLLADARPIFISIDETSLPKGITVFSAASGEQLSTSSQTIKHGLFTYHFIKGLTGAADANDDSKITESELATYLKDKVSQDALVLDREQTPGLQSWEEDRVLFRY